VLFGPGFLPEDAERTLEAAILKEIGVATDVMVRDLASCRR
jgi:hypothetical protein